MAALSTSTYGKTAAESCALPDCSRPRNPMFLGWHENDMITSAYCDDHGPTLRVAHCSECGADKSSRHVWPDGIPPLGVLNGKVGTLNVD